MALDLTLVTAAAAFFLVAWLYVGGCDAIVREAETEGGGRDAGSGDRSGR
jgi:hypothetical protein